MFRHERTHHVDFNALCTCIVPPTFHPCYLDIALVVLDKCTEERFDRDDVSFEMKFDYEFVEDFYNKRLHQPPSSQPTATAKVVFRGSGKGSLDSIPGEVKESGEREGEVELKEVKVVTRDHGSDDDGVVVKRSVAGEDDTDDANTSSPPSVVYIIYMHMYSFTIC